MHSNVRRPPFSLLSNWMGANLSRLPLWLGFGLHKGSSKNVRQAIVFVLFHPLAGLQGGSFELRVNGKPACWAEGVVFACQCVFVEQECCFVLSVQCSPHCVCVFISPGFLCVLFPSCSDSVSVVSFC